MKALMMLGLGLGLLSGPLQAARVTLTDGSSLSGETKEQANGDLVVSTGAGEITVAKDKIRSVIQDGQVSESAAGVDNSYVEGVEARRAKYGNKDGLPHTQNLQQDQLAVTIGQLNYVGDAFLVKDATGATVLSASDSSGISYGLNYAHSFTDWVALEVWGSYAAASKDFSIAGTSYAYRLQSFNVGVGPKIQKAIALGGPEQAITLIPNIGLTPIWSSASGSIDKTTVSFNSSSVGASLNAGLDFQFGGALIGAKARYLLASDVTGNLKSNNTSAWMPQLSVGFSF